MQVSFISSERENFADASRVNFNVLTICSAIVTSRKRKLRELFAVATQIDPLPKDAFANPDAPAATNAEWQFLQTNDISQYVPPDFYTMKNTSLRFAIPIYFPCFGPDSIWSCTGILEFHNPFDNLDVYIFTIIIC